MTKLKIKKDDEVVVIAGKDKGKKGKIIKVFPEENRVIVAGVNVVARHQRATQMAAAGINRKEAPIHASNVMLVDAKSGKGTRVGYTFNKDGSKSRMAKRSGEVING